MRIDHLDSFETPDVVDVLVAEYLDALDHGQAPPRSDWLDRYPEHVAELARFLDDLERLSPPASTAQANETQVLPGNKTSRETLARDSETVIWNAPSAPGGLAPTSAEPLPFSGSFGDYELLETVARGGMGVVFKARHRQLDRVVALKMILAGQLAGPEEIQRFRAEAQAAAKLDHPGIVPVYEVGEELGLHYFTMAFVEGKSLAERLVEGPIAPKDAARLVRDLAAAVAYAHEHGIVHRDLKPANVLIDAQGQPKLTDFGLAKQTQHDNQMTGTGQIVGTPSYMAPEQAKCDPAAVGPSSDVYGLGALLFALLTGRPPFQGVSPVDTIQHVLSAEPARPRLLNPNVPRDLETICLKCLEKAPAKRYGSASALGEDLDRFLDDRPIVARPAGVIEKGWRWYRRRPLIGTMAAALALLLIAVPLLLAGFWQEAEVRAGVEAAAHQKEKEAREREEETGKQIKKLERERTRQLFQAYVNEAAARRSSPRVGRRFEALNRILAARELADELKLPSEDYVRLRSEAISALSLTDLRATTTGPGWTHRAVPFAHVSGSNCAWEWDKPSGLLVRRIGDNRVVQRIPDVIERVGQYHDYPLISPDSRYLSLVSNFNLVVWQIDGDKPKEVVRRANTYAVAFAPDRAEAILLTRQREIVVQPLDGKGEPKVLRIPAIEKEPQLLHFHDLVVAGRRLAVAGANRVSIVDLDAGKVTSVCGLPDRVHNMAWSPDGATLSVVCMDASVVFYQPVGASRRVVKVPLGGAERANFDPSGRYLFSISQWSGRGILWNVAEARAELRFTAAELEEQGPARADPQSDAWWQGALDVPYQVVDLHVTEGLRFNVSSSAVHPGGRLLAARVPQGIALADLGTGQRIGILPVGKGFTVRFDSAGNLYGCANKQPLRWPITREGDHFKIGRPERLDLPAQDANLDVSADGRFVAQAITAGAVVLDRQTGKTTSLGPQQDVRHVAVLPNGALVATFSWNTPEFRLWETRTGKLLHVYEKVAGRWGQFTPDGKYLIAGAKEASEVQLWSMPDCKPVRRLGAWAPFAISPDSRYVAAAEVDGKVRLNRIDNGDLIARFDTPGQDYLSDIYFSSDGRYLVGMNLERTRHHVWDLWKLRHQLRELKLDWETTPAPRGAVVGAAIVVEIAPEN